MKISKFLIAISLLFTSFLALADDYTYKVTIQNHTSYTGFLGSTTNSENIKLSPSYYLPNNIYPNSSASWFVQSADSTNSAQGTQTVQYIFAANKQSKPVATCTFSTTIIYDTASQTYKGSYQVSCDNPNFSATAGDDPSTNGAIYYVSQVSTTQK